LSSLGSLAGAQLGKTSGKLLGSTVFATPKKEEKDKKKVTLNELLNQTRQKIMGAPEQKASGLQISI
jgi:hypothetical protein